MGETPNISGVGLSWSHQGTNGEDCGGGVYLWESRAAAEAWFNDEWWGWIEERFGARPTLTYFDHYVTVDNAAGEIRVDGGATAIAAE